MIPIVDERQKTETEFEPAQHYNTSLGMKEWEYEEKFVMGA
jgi:hypothetical protein